MYLSQLILNPHSRQVRSELARPYELHRTVMSGFTNMAEGERILYRLDLSIQNGIPKILVQSQFPPDWTKLQAKDGYFLDLPMGNPQVKEYAPQLRAGQCLAFRLVANPTKTKKDPDGDPKQRGKRVAINSEQDQIEWLKRKGQAGGFQIVSARVTRLGEQHLMVPDDNDQLQPARFSSVRFDGELVVTDPDAFHQILKRGIGSAKGFGCGLISIAPVALNS